MAVFKNRLLRKTSSGGYDTVHLETDTSLVICPDGKTLDETLTEIKTLIGQVGAILDAINREVI